MNIERLKNLRIQAKKSQKDVADDLGIDRTTYVKYESGVNSPGSKRLDQLANYFGVTTDYLLGRDEEAAIDIKMEPSLPPEILELASRIDKLPPEIKQHILQQIALFEKMDSPK